jgi:hypothetical protein
MQNTNSPRTYRTYNVGLSKHIQVQLLEDIEFRGGGIKSKDDFQEIYNDRIEIYGEAGSELWQKVKNKVSYWRKVPFDEYLLILKNFEVEVNKDNYLNIGRKQHLVTPLKSSLKSVRETPPSSSSRMPPRRGYGTFSCHVTFAWLVSLITFLPIIATRSAMAGIKAEAEVIMIDVDPLNPERNREFYVLKFQGVVHDGVMYDGFEISMFGVDLCDTKGTGYYDAFIDTEENALVVTCPATPYFYLHDNPQAQEMDMILGTHVIETEKSHKVTRTALDDFPDKNTCEYHLIFPSDIRIISSALNMADNHVPAKNFLISTGVFTIEGNPHPCSHEHDIISWTVLIKEDQPRRVESQKKGVEGTVGSRLARKSFVSCTR